MRRGRVFASTVVAATSLMGLTIAYSQDFLFTDDEDVIEHRQHIMKSMGEQAKIIGMILDGRAPTEDFASHIKVLSITASTAKQAFESKVSGGDATDAIWNDWDDFSKRLDELTAATRNVALIAEKDGVAAAKQLVGDALTCKGCHDKYRADD